MATIGVLGTGMMGAGIVQVAAQSGYDVVACDRSVEALERAQLYGRDCLSRFATNLDVLSYMHGELGDTYYAPPRIVKSLVHAGRKTGAGFYDYS